MSKFVRIISFVLVLFSSVFFVQSVNAKRWVSIDEVAAGVIDPHVGNDYADLILIGNLYNSLMWVSSKDLVPSLAESVDISADGKTYTFKIRKGVKFHNGDEMKSEDVLFSFNRSMDMGLGFSYLIKSLVEGMSTPDDNTFVINVNAAQATFLGSMTRIPIVNKSQCLANKQDGDFGENGDYCQEYLKTNDIGTGAYKIVSHNEIELTVMDKFNDHFQPFNPKAPDEARMRYSLDAPTLRALMEKGEHHASSMWFPFEFYAAIDKVDGISAVQQEQVGTYVGKINTKRAPTDNIHLRNAIVAAIDYDAVAKILYVNDEVSGGGASTGPIPKGMLGHDNSRAEFKQDLELAKKELALSGYDASTAPVIELTALTCCATHQKMAYVTQASLEAIGINTKIVDTEWMDQMANFVKPETTHHISFIAHSMMTPDIDSLFREIWHSSSTTNGWSATEWLKDPAVDALLDQGRAELDPSKRATLYAAAEQKILDSSPDIFLAAPNGVYASSDLVLWPFQNPEVITGYIWADFDFRLTETDAMKD